MITTEIKKRIVQGIIEAQRNYPSGTKLAVALGINPSVLSRIKNGETENVLAPGLWISVARKLEVQINETAKWATAKTPVYNYIYTQLEACQKHGISGLLCDMADIGKTYTAKQYALENKNAVYIDCSQEKTKNKLIRAIAKELGVTHTGRYAEVYADLVFYLKGTLNPLIILDEAGDLEYPAFLELKALWNATEGCGWYMMGADGLKVKIEGNLERKKVGYTEIFSRYGSRYQKIAPVGKDDIEAFKQAQVALITKANNPIADVQKMYVKTNGSLRRIKIELQKLQYDQASN